MKNEIKHTAHSTYRCEYHIVFAPKYRRKEIKSKIKILSDFNDARYSDKWRIVTESDRSREPSSEARLRGKNPPISRLSGKKLYCLPA